jgi:hypothetical protein
MDELQVKLTYVTGDDGARTATIPDEQRTAAIAYVREHGAKPPAEIEAIVREGYDGVLQALDGVSEEQAAYKPGPDDWSILELLAHVISAQRVIRTLAGSLAGGALPEGFGPQWEEAAAQDGITVVRFDTLAEARAALQAAHDDWLTFIRGIDGATNRELTFRHYIFGAFNAPEWAVFQRIHDINHTPQIGEIKSSPGYPRA